MHLAASAFVLARKHYKAIHLFACDVYHLKNYLSPYRKNNENFFYTVPTQAMQLQTL